jgi:hypothetical protein
VPLPIVLAIAFGIVSSIPKKLNVKITSCDPQHFNLALSDQKALRSKQSIGLKQAYLFGVVQEEELSESSRAEILRIQ